MWRNPPGRLAKTVDTEVLAKIYTQQWNQNLIDSALASRKAGTRLEGRVANHVRNKLVGFQKDIFRTDGTQFTEIDVELPNAIIETTVGKTGKARQVADKMLSRLSNPNAKPVIVFGPKLGKHAIESIRSVGGLVARSFDELDELLSTL